MKSVDNHFDKILISYVEQHPCLYDSRHVFYTDKAKRAEAWLAVASKLETTVEVVKIRWKSLKKGFTKAYRESNRKGFSAKQSKRECNHCIAFPFFESMLWLKPYISNYKKCPIHGKLDSSILKTIGSLNNTTSPTEESSDSVSDSYITNNTSTSGKSCSSKCHKKESHSVKENKYKYKETKGKRESKISCTENRNESIENKGYFIKDEKEDIFTHKCHKSSSDNESIKCRGVCSGNEKSDSNKLKSKIIRKEKYEILRTNGNETPLNVTEVEHIPERNTCDKNCLETCSAKNKNSKNKNKYPISNSSDKTEPEHRPSIDQLYESNLHPKESSSNFTITKLVNDEQKHAKSGGEITNGKTAFNLKACEEGVTFDMNFMLSVVSDMQMIPKRKKVTFKREVMELLEKYVMEESC